MSLGDWNGSISCKTLPVLIYAERLNVTLPPIMSHLEFNNEEADKKMN